MDRRTFFRRGLKEAAEVAVKHADAQVSKRAGHWIRPPFALAELEFLLACTRCGECAVACPHGVVFLLPARLGAQVLGTPALDLLTKGCLLCEDWPCVAACEPGALRLPEGNDDEPRPPPRMAVVSIDTQSCLPYSGPECGVCAASCPVPEALLWEGERPRIDPGVCTGCALCREACIVEPKAVHIRSLHRQPDGAADPPSETA
jgi:ferredoxin-type protein NapG